ncbi:uncharacterized protein LOC120284377 [Drosophila simulans]|uniref:uncharacterized protein LOC120284377 n=1 Tax=Drosophila simulans TaxID=7240 RepID=UPI00192CE6DD|nr:uncharacterized protein LOC120284377 [Drosophila simulans]
MNVVDSTRHKQIIAGTFLATYDDYVSLNGTRYVNHRGILKKKPAVSTSAVVNITLFRDHLSLQFLHDLTMKNLRNIGDLRTGLSSRSYGGLHSSPYSYSSWAPGNCTSAE